MSDEEVQNGKPRFRSPPYPSIDLAKAIERAKQVYAKAMHHPAGVGVLAEAWGYKEKSSGLWATAAALLHYGLARDEGSGPKRKFSLSDIAIRIIRDADPESEKRKEAIRRAAMAPAIHTEICNQFGSDPAVSDIVLKNYLTLDRADEGKAAFSDQSADDVIRVYKDTMSYAGFADSAILPLVDEEIDEAADVSLSDAGQKQTREPERPKTPPVAKGVILMDGERILQDGILSRDATYRIIVSGKIGAREIERLIAKLELDKEILAEEDDVITSTNASQQPS
ncbi:hypothetical protein NKH33_30575 [Mesorhizobium sp. M1182]|uniref:hypothetical protein n=1 Tax=Mesorhizobium sp. M1182 TaxID=2957067 RepID=UPI00333B41E5